MYYIFLDDDIVLFGIQETTLNPWRKLEDSLRKMEPAMAAILIVWGDKQKCINARNRFYKAKQKQKCSFNRTTGFFSSGRLGCSFQCISLSISEVYSTILKQI